MRVIDFCSGAGGTSEGIRAAGGKVILAVDSDPLALATHAANHNSDHLNAFVEEIDPTGLPDHDVGAWCPPCQDYSYASGRSAAQASGQVLQAMLKITEACLPKYLMFENVPAIRGWPGFGAWYASLQRLGYWLTSDIYDASAWVPQERHRFVLLGCRGPKAPAKLTPPIRRKPLAAEKILDFKNGNWGSMYLRTTSLIKRIRAASDRLGKRFLMSSNNTRAEWSGRGLERPIGTIMTTPHWLLVDDDRTRYITQKESARAQGFPDTYKFLGGSTDQYKQIGNAFPPALAAAAFTTLTMT